MAINNVLQILSLICMVLVLSAILSQSQENGCGQVCETWNDCPGQLICTSTKCTDDPDVGTHICSDTTDGCESSGTLKGTDPPSTDACNVACCTSSTTYLTYDCSPAVSSATPAILTLNDFTEGGGAGGASSCEGKYYSNTEAVVSLSTGWFSNRSRCSQMIRINANGKSVLARVVDECDSRHGCDEEHGYQSPCWNNIVDASVAVWDALGVSKDEQGNDLPITWSMANSRVFTLLLFFE